MRVTSDLNILLTHMQPELNPGRYAFVTLPFGMEVDPAFVVASIRESEGLSVIIPEKIALELGLSVAFTAAWITVTLPLLASLPLSRMLLPSPESVVT